MVKWKATFGMTLNIDICWLGTAILIRCRLQNLLYAEIAMETEMP